jgi:8-oxo-dGTP pyrophosphatase MutT (NUDIX family)
MIRHYTASAIILNREEVLLVKHARMGVWLYPGGHVDANEDPAQAMHREVREEVGIDVEIIGESRIAHGAVGVVPAPFTILVQDVTDTKVGPHQHIDMVYVCRPLSSDVAHQADELLGSRWVPCAAVSGLATPPELPSLIDVALRYADSYRMSAR